MFKTYLEKCYICKYMNRNIKNDRLLGYIPTDKNFIKNIIKEDGEIQKDTDVITKTLTTNNIFSDDLEVETITSNSLTLSQADTETMISLNNTSATDSWGIYQQTSNGSADNDALYFKYGSNNRAYIRYDADVGQIDFTGQHRCLCDDKEIYDSNYIGLIVISTGNYKNLTNDNISINDALPKVELSQKEYQKSCFGVISDSEDTSGYREYSLGAFSTVLNKTDTRLIINSLGEGGIWVSDINGNIENGDYITTSNIPGIGMRQERNKEFLCNYTVAKVTCNWGNNNDSNLNYIKILGDKYEVYNDDILSNKRFEYYFNFEENNIQLINKIFKIKFLGCTYHCG